MLFNVMTEVYPVCRYISDKPVQQQPTQEILPIMACSAEGAFFVCDGKMKLRLTVEIVASAASDIAVKHAEFVSTASKRIKKTGLRVQNILIVHPDRMIAHLTVTSRYMSYPGDPGEIGGNLIMAGQTGLRLLVNT